MSRMNTHDRPVRSPKEPETLPEDDLRAMAAALGGAPTLQRAADELQRLRLLTETQIAALMARATSAAGVEPAQHVQAKVVTIHDACAAISLSPATIRRMIRDGQLRSISVRGRRLIPASEIERLVGSTEGGLAAEPNRAAT